MPDLYNIGAARGRIVGQGLMGMGHIASKGIESQRQAKERKAERQFTKTLSIVNLYTKMGDDLTPENRMKLYTGALIPMLAKAGGLPKDPKQEDVSKFIGSLAANSKEAMQGFRDDNDKLLELVNGGKWKEADKFLSGMMTEYGKMPGAKPFLDHAKTLLKDEKTHSRAKKEREAKSQKEIDKTIGGWLAEGKVQEVPKTGLLKGLEDKGTTFKYGGRQFYKEDEEKLGFEAKEKIKAKYTGQAKGPEVKESAAIKEMETIKKGIDKYKTTGGLTGELFAAIRAFDSDLAEDIKGMPHEEAIEFMKKRYNYLFDSFVSKKNKSKYGFEKFEKKAAISNITHTFKPGKGLVPVE